MTEYEFLSMIAEAFGFTAGWCISHLVFYALIVFFGYRAIKNWIGFFRKIKRVYRIKKIKKKNVTS